MRSRPHPNAKQARRAGSRRRVATYWADRVALALSDRFSNVVPLGRDQFVEFHLATETETGRLVKIKTLNELASRELRFKEMFLLEGYAAASLKHLNIVRCGKPDELRGVLYCTTEHKPDTKRLRDLIDCAGWLDVDQAVSIADQIASALSYAHSRSVLHLRLQPENILVESDGWVTVTDFGLAAGGEIAHAHRQRSFRQASAYLSPEQARGEHVDRRTDLYALGAIVYEMLAERVPFEARGPRELHRLRISQNPAPPHLLSPRVPEAISSVVMGLLETARERRFGEATTFQAALLGASMTDQEVVAGADSLTAWLVEQPQRVC